MTHCQKGLAKGIASKSWMRYYRECHSVLAYRTNSEKTLPSLQHCDQEIDINFGERLMTGSYARRFFISNTLYTIIGQSIMTRLNLAGNIGSFASSVFCQ